ncbi:MAG: NAD-dependent epimerase/dehydratase family protein [Bacteroidetes bacterium]|nr:NAD-dependent epimerase/dehydratase family protein [Bacteroidota bacterium]
MILVTGGTGMIGSRLLYDLVKGGHKVRALKRENSSIHLLKYTQKKKLHYANSLLGLMVIYSKLIA